MRYTFSVLFFFLCLTLSSQIFYRIECDISIKEINASGRQQLLVGKVYFDKNIRKIIYDIRFPDASRFAVTDYGVVTDTSKVELDRVFTSHLVDFSVFNLILNGQLKYYGLDNTAYQLVNASKEGELVISEWELPVEMGSDFGKMLVSQKDNQLYGMVSLDADNHVVSKQFLKDYTTVDGISIPSRLIQINYRNDTVLSKKITTFRDVHLNAKEDAHYHFK